MAARNRNERAHVNALVKAIRKNSPGVHVHIDRDAGNVRHTSSGWDFFLAHEGRVVFCEAKESNGKLSDWQEFVRAEILLSGTPYLVVRFCEDGRYFSTDITTKIKIEHACILDFIK